MASVRKPSHILRFVHLRYPNILPHRSAHIEDVFLPTVGLELIVLADNYRQTLGAVESCSKALEYLDFSLLRS